MLYGRDQQLAALLHPRTRVTVVSGDSGVGKTSLLGEVVARFDGLAPPPVPVGHAPAALQAGLLEALGAAAALIAQDEGAARRVGKLLVEGGRRLAQAKADEIGHAVARVALSIARDRLGSNLADVLGEYFEQVRSAATDDLASRIRQAADPDVMQAIAGLAADVASDAGKHLLLTLDKIDGLQPDDRARLKDLGPLLRPEVSVICAFTSLHRADESVLDQFRLAGISVERLYGLEQWAVRQWLEAEGLPGELSGQVWRKTNGYGLAVAAAIDLLKAGTNLADAGMEGRTEIVSAATREALRQLDSVTLTAAFKLSVLPVPLPAARVIDFLETDPGGWAGIEGALIDAHLFLPGDPPWFHEQRRLLLRDQIQDSVPYLQAAVAQLGALAQVPEAPGDTVIHYADVSDALIVLGVSDPAVSAVASLDDDALAVLGAVIELTDGDSRVVNGEQALLYARQVFRRSGDLKTALARVSEASLVATASALNQIGVVATFGSVEAFLYANGKIGARLGRLPIPRVASLVFSARLSSALEPFASATYGVGDPPLGELAKLSVDLQVRPQHTQLVRPGRKGPSLLVQARFGDTPIYAAVAYEQQQERDTALSRVQALTPEPVSGRPVEITVVTVQPDAVLPSLRLVRAFERALGIPVNNIHGVSDVKMNGQPISDQEAAQQQLAALNLLTKLSNARERQVTGHSAMRYGLLWLASQDGDGELTAVVADAEGIIPLSSTPTVTLFGMPDHMELKRLAGLEAHQVIGFTRYHGGQPQQADMQPVINEAVRHARNIVAYNELQSRRRIPIDPGKLQTLIQRELDEREATAQTVAEVFGRTLPDGHDLYLLIEPYILVPGMVPGADRNAAVVETPMRGESPSIRVAIYPELNSYVSHPADPSGNWMTQWEQALSEAFAITEVKPVSIARSSMLHAIARLLGHVPDEIWLVETAALDSGELTAGYLHLPTQDAVRASPEHGAESLNVFSELFPTWLCRVELQYVNGLGEFSGAPRAAAELPEEPPRFELGVRALA